MADQFRICRTDKDAFIFEKAHVNDAGYDIKAFADGVIPARGRTMVATKIRVHIPSGYYGRIASRSGLSKKYGIEVGAGVVDKDYNDEIGVILYNHSDKDFVYGKGDRIAQFILTKIYTGDMVEVTEADMNLLNEADRKGGFGSTGK